jgi:hypothetical protein
MKGTFRTLYQDLLMILRVVAPPGEVWPGPAHRPDALRIWCAPAGCGFRERRFWDSGSCPEWAVGDAERQYRAFQDIGGAGVRGVARSGLVHLDRKEAHKSSQLFALGTQATAETFDRLPRDRRDDATQRRSSANTEREMSVLRVRKRVLAPTRGHRLHSQYFCPWQMPTLPSTAFTSVDRLDTVQIAMSPAQPRAACSVAPLGAGRVTGPHS